MFSLVLALLVCAVLIPAPERTPINTIRVCWGQYISDALDGCIDINAAAAEEAAGHPCEL